MKINVPMYMFLHVHGSVMDSSKTLVTLPDMLKIMLQMTNNNLRFKNLKL